MAGPGWAGPGGIPFVLEAMLLAMSMALRSWGGGQLEGPGVY